MKCERDPIIGDPDDDHLSTSYVERQNLTTLDADAPVSHA